MTELELTMLSMVSANRLINIGAIPLVAAAYAVFLCIDHNRNANIAHIEHLIQDIQNVGSVDGFVFGGSNALYSLSAESLNYYTGMKWYNAAMPSEEVTGARIIQDLSTPIDRTKVQYVVYSSILPYTNRTFTNYELDQKVYGEGVKPSRSFVSYIKNGSDIAPLRNSAMLARNGFGDIVFNKIKCDFAKHYGSFITTKRHLYLIHEREEIDTTVESLVDNAIYFASNFPNASILIVLPSGYYAESISVDSIVQALQTKFYSALSTRHSQNSMVKIIVQPPYASITQVCNGPWHANEDGRVWRTENLIELMAMSLGRTFGNGQRAQILANAASFAP
jgi:hypothetical protein